MAVLGLKPKKAKVAKEPNQAKASHSDDAKAFLEEMERKKQASPDTCMFC